MKICVYGAASDLIDRRYIEETEELGREMARRGHELVYGGGATGLMGAVSRGVAELGGKVIGIAPHFMKDFEALNQNSTEIIMTSDMSDRKDVMESMAEAFIITPGGIGTFDEFFEILTLTNLNQKNVKIAVFNVMDYYTPLLEFVKDCVDKKFVAESVPGTCPAFYDIDEMLDYLEN